MHRWWSSWRPTKLRYYLCELYLCSQNWSKYMKKPIVSICSLSQKKFDWYLIFLQQYLLDILREKKDSEKHTTYKYGRSKARDALKNPGFGPIADEDQVRSKVSCTFYWLWSIFCVCMYSVPTYEHFQLTWAESSSELFWSPVVCRLSVCPSVCL